MAELLKGDVTQFHEWEKSTPYSRAAFHRGDGGARRGYAACFGPRKTVGLRDPKTGGVPMRWCAPAGQRARTLWNMVGFSDQAQIRR